jgi:hypothetical protein
MNAWPPSSERGVVAAAHLKAFLAGRATSVDEVLASVGDHVSEGHCCIEPRQPTPRIRRAESHSLKSTVEYQGRCS